MSHLTHLPYPLTKIPGSALLKTYLMLDLKKMAISQTLILKKQKKRRHLASCPTTTLKETAIDFVDYEFPPLKGLLL